MGGLQRGSVGIVLGSGEERPARCLLAVPGLLCAGFGS